MRFSIHSWLSGGLLACGLASVAMAGPLEDGHAAIDRGDYSAAMQILRPMADKGDTQADYLVGSFYYRGLGVTRSYEEAASWYRRAADADYAPAQYELGNMYATGLGVGQDRAQAIVWYRRAAQLGSTSAMRSLGQIYGGGIGVAKDETEAARWFRMQAEHGDPEGMLTIASYLSIGNGIPANQIESLRFLRLALDNSSDNPLVCARAALQLAHMYESGNGVPMDFTEAFRLYRIAADLGYRPGALALARMYRNGLGVTKDPALQAYWETKPGETLFPYSRVVVSPGWSARPTGADLQRVYPQKALRERTPDHATMKCNLTMDGKLEECKIIEETPADQGFGVATLSLAHLFQMRLAPNNGKRISAQVIVPVGFRIN